MTRALIVALFVTWFPSGNKAQAHESSANHSSPEFHQPRKAFALRRDSVERRDLAGRLGPRVCGGIPAEPQSLWELGIFDAQIEGVLLSSKTQFEGGLLAFAQKKSRLLARLNHLGGYAYGLCPDGAKAWAVAVPSPELITPPSSDRKLLLPIASLKARCASYTVDFAAERGGLPQKVPVDKKDFVDTKAMPSGVVSVTCQPRAPSWQGPVLWAMVPVKRDGDVKLPIVLQSDEKNSLSDNLARWIGQIREKEGLPPLVRHAELDHYAELLAIDGSLRHNRTQQALIAQKLRDTSTSPIGEDRVRARDLSSMAWLLWHSPRHRGLLLDPGATAVGIGLKSVGPETLAVVLTGKTVNKTTVLRPDNGPGKALR